MLLLFTGSYGRFTAGLPAENPYHQHRHPRPGVPTAAVRDGETSALDRQRTAAAAAEMAEAERAVAQGASGAERASVRSLAGLSTHEARLRAWLADSAAPAADVRR